MSADARLAVPAPTAHPPTTSAGLPASGSLPPPAAQVRQTPAVKHPAHWAAAQALRRQRLTIVRSPTPHHRAHLTAGWSLGSQKEWGAATARGPLTGL